MDDCSAVCASVQAAIIITRGVGFGFYLETNPQEERKDY